MSLCTAEISGLDAGCCQPSFSRQCLPGLDALQPFLGELLTEPRDHREVP